MLNDMNAWLDMSDALPLFQVCQSEESVSQSASQSVSQSGSQHNESQFSHSVKFRDILSYILFHIQKFVRRILVNGEYGRLGWNEERKPIEFNFRRTQASVLMLACHLEVGLISLSHSQS